MSSSKIGKDILPQMFMYLVKKSKIVQIFVGFGAVVVGLPVSLNGLIPFPSVSSQGFRASVRTY